MTKRKVKSYKQLRAIVAARKKRRQAAFENAVKTVHNTLIHEAKKGGNYFCKRIVSAAQVWTAMQLLPKRKKVMGSAVSVGRCLRRNGLVGVARAGKPRSLKNEAITASQLLGLQRQSASQGWGGN